MDNDSQTIYQALALARRFTQDPEIWDDALARDTITRLADALEILFQSHENIRQLLAQLSR